LVDVKRDLEVYFRLDENERRIIQAAARMGDTPLACAVFELYFPTLSPERLRILRGAIATLKA
jgi:hypothetical protein